MLEKLTQATIWVHDQDEALDFYTRKLGMEVREDVTFAEMGNYRWLTVGPTRQPDVSFILTVPSPPVIDGDLARQLTDFIAKGVIGSFHFSTDDCQATYLELKERGVDFIMEPTEMPYGIDAQFHDPSGNKLRFTQTR
ncbi:MAG: VOC family protein [Acidimicrobiales bacterium]|jgi:predicted enzyme related to lactoylglutathione lyase